MNKWLICLLAVLVLLAGCSKGVTIKNVTKQPNFKGVATEVNEHSIMVKVSEDEDEAQSSDLISVSLNVELEESMTDFNVGDEVRVYYNGEIALSYPAQIHKVYAIMLEE